MDVLQEAKAVFDCEIESLQLMKNALDENFDKLVNEIEHCTGSVVWVGIGKSGHICRKIVSTMQSLGIKAYFLHPAEGLHGDLGVLDNKDLVIVLSNSGETDEVLSLVPNIQKIGARMVCIVGRPGSTLQRLSEFAVVLPPMKEAYLNTIVPTSSTTASLVIGDALAIAVAKKKNFTAIDFSMYHPKGLLGKKLTLTVGDIMLKGDENSVISEGSTVKQALFEMCRKAISGVNIVNSRGQFCGLLTDGDMRRLFNRNVEGMMDVSVDTLMTRNPFSFSSNTLVYDVVQKINEKNQGFTFFPVIDNGILVGTVRMLDITKSGLMG